MNAILFAILFACDRSEFLNRVFSEFQIRLDLSNQFRHEIRRESHNSILKNNKLINKSRHIPISNNLAHRFDQEPAEAGSEDSRFNLRAPIQSVEMREQLPDHSKEAS